MTISEENYLKIIYLLSENTSKEISTNAIADMVKAKASSVTDMIKKLANKELINYEKYQGVTLTELGIYKAIIIIRRQRLWETFLVDKLNFSWDEVHEIAEELEHIKSEKLINHLDAFLNFPRLDPHGDSIPNQDGIIYESQKALLSEADLNKKYICVGVKDTSSHFLQFLNNKKITIGTIIEIIERENYDNTLIIKIENTTTTISNKIASNLYINNIDAN